MKIDLAVYTAIHGYDWQPGSVYSTSDLVRYKRGIGRLPDPLMEALPFGGVFNDGDTVVFYRYHMAIKSDAKGRDSLYLVLGTLPKAEIGKVDFKYLFALSEFAKTMKPAPVQTTYIGSVATGRAPDFSSSLRQNHRGAAFLSEIGTWFSRLPDGTLSMRISGTYADPVVGIQYEKPHLEQQMSAFSNECELLSTQPTANRQEGSQSFGSGFHPVPPSPPVPQRPEPQSVLLPVLLALLVGGIAGWYAKAAKDWFVDAIRSMQERRVLKDDQPPSQPMPQLAPPNWQIQPKPKQPSYFHPVQPSSAQQSNPVMQDPIAQIVQGPIGQNNEDMDKPRENTFDLATGESIESGNNPEESKESKNEKDCSSRR